MPLPRSAGGRCDPGSAMERPVGDRGSAAVSAPVGGFDTRVVLAGLCTPLLPQAPFSSPLLPPLHRAGTALDQALQELSPIRNKSIFEQPSQFGASGFCRTLSEEFRGIFECRCADDSPQILMTQNLWGESSTPRRVWGWKIRKSPSCSGLCPRCCPRTGVMGHLILNVPGDGGKGGQSPDGGHCHAPSN